MFAMPNIVTIRSCGIRECRTLQDVTRRNEDKIEMLEHKVIYLTEMANTNEMEKGDVSFTYT